MSESTTVKSQTSYPLTNPPAGYLPVARACSFMVNVASDMCQQWIKQNSPQSPSAFHWSPADPCPYTSAYKLSDYNIWAELIWSKFTYKGLQYNEPFAFVAAGRNANYLAFRGSQTKVDFDLDGDDPQVAYTPDGGPSGMLVEAGFYTAFAGCSDAISATLEKLKSFPWIPMPPVILPASETTAKSASPNSNPLYITGHSLGSTLATLAVPLAVAAGWQGMQCNQASPRVGNAAFANYIDGFTQMPTYRLVNTEDLVPKLPPAAVRVDKETYYYQHAGTEVDFTAFYPNDKGKLDEKDEHSPCCSYSYGLFNPTSPVNPDITQCVATLEPKING